MGYREQRRKREEVDCYREGVVEDEYDDAVACHR
jgi:hypothetical protein